MPLSGAIGDIIVLGVAGKVIESTQPKKRAKKRQKKVSNEIMTTEMLLFGRR